MNKQQIKPMKKYVAYGKGGIINASVWRRERKFPNGKMGHFENVSINRSYLDICGDWMQRRTRFEKSAT